MREIATLIARRDAKRAPLDWLNGQLDRMRLKVRTRTDAKFQLSLTELVDKAREALVHAEARRGEAFVQYQDTVEAQEIAAEELEHVINAVEVARNA